MGKEKTGCAYKHSRFYKGNFRIHFSMSVSVSQIEKEFLGSNQISFSEQHERQVHLYRFSIIQFFYSLVILFKYHPPF